MAKGNLFLSQARGKVGSVVFSVIKGQQIERVYNAKPANPKTMAQQAQRSLLANMTKYYKRGASNFFKFAFEDKTARESDFNAFARHNTQRGVYMPRMFYESQGVPALGNYELTNGSLAVNTPDYFSGENYVIVVPGTTAISTVGQLSSALLAANPQILEGDIFTMVLADSTMSADMIYSDEPPTWQIHQFFIEPSSLQPITQVGLSDLGAGTTAGTRYVGVSIIGIDRASFGATIFSRNTAEGLKVTTSEIKGSAVARVLVDWLRGEYMRRQAAISWNGNPDAVLQGGLINPLPEVTSIAFGNPETQLPAYAYGNTLYNIEGASTSEIYISGANLRTTAQGGRYVLKLYNADILADGLAVSPVVEYEFNAAGSSAALTLTRPAAATRNGDQFYMLLEVNGVPVWYGQAISGA